MSHFKMSDLSVKGEGRKTPTTEVNYFWKKFDFTNGRTFSQVHSEHHYCKDPVKSASKYDLIFWAYVD